MLLPLYTEGIGTEKAAATVSVPCCLLPVPSTKNDRAAVLPPCSESPYSCRGFRCQILSLYSEMVRSEVNMAELAVFITAFLSHRSLSS